MSDVDFGGLVCISFVVIVLFHVGFSTPNWIKMQEVTSANSTNNSTLSLTTRTCHHGLFYSYDCPESENGIIFFKKQVDDIYTIIWLSWYLTYIDVLSICLTSEFSLYGKRNVVFFFFHLQSEAKLNVRFTLIFMLIIYTRWQIVKRGGGFLLGHTLKPCVPWSHLTGLAPNCPSLTFGPKFGLASNIDLLSNLVVGNLVTS